MAVVQNGRRPVPAWPLSHQLWTGERRCPARARTHPKLTPFPVGSKSLFHHPPWSHQSLERCGPCANTGVVTYQTHYETLGRGEGFSASSRIRFTSREVLAAMLDETGVEVDEWLGDWRGEARTPTLSEIIPPGRLR